jgi:hypothetical protein
MFLCFIRGGFPQAPRPRCGLLYIPSWISNQPPYPISPGATFAPPTREQWYLLASPFLPEADGTKRPPPNLLEKLDAMISHHTSTRCWELLLYINNNTFIRTPRGKKNAGAKKCPIFAVTCFSLSGFGIGMSKWGYMKLVSF